MRTVKGTVVIERRPLAGSLKEFQPITIHLVNRTELKPVWDHMVRTYYRTSGVGAEGRPMSE
jgi:hypothetical protein